MEKPQNFSLPVGHVYVCFRHGGRLARQCLEHVSLKDESPYEEVARYGTDERCVKIRNLEKRSADYVLEGIWFEDSNPVKELCSIDTKPKHVKPGGVIELCAPVCQEALKTRNPVYFSGLIIKAEDR